MMMTARDNPRGDLFVVSAPSGAGKTTLLKRLLRRVDGLEFSVSYTTRPPRRGERDGVDYHFVTEARFRRHHKKIKEADIKGMVPLDDMLVRITQQDAIHRRYLVKGNRAYVPDWGVYLVDYDGEGNPKYHTM